MDTNTTTTALALIRRTWCYILPPYAYEISGCPHCKFPKCLWSEFAHMSWCPMCSKDFFPAHGGIFDGPIPVETCRMLGIVFDRYELSTGRVVKFGDPEWEKTWP